MDNKINFFSEGQAMKCFTEKKKGKMYVRVV